MPRGKNISRKNKRNENALTTQLMRISLRMDDHIYNDRPIATADAARFLHEITSLKLQCLPTNARALQVIEKLTRLMRNILTEDGGHASSSFNKSFQINTELAGSASPVYSLPDEDRINDIYAQNNVDLNTCISDDETIHRPINMSHGHIATEFAVSAPVYALTDENKINDIHGQDFDTDYLNTSHAPHKEMCVSREFNMNTSNKPGYITISQPRNNGTHPKNTIDNSEIIDITNDSDIDEANETVAVLNKQTIAIEHVSSGISNMAIYDKVPNHTKPVDDDNCSQSVLENYVTDNEREATANKKDRVVANKAYNENNAKACVISKVNNYFLKQTPLAVKSSQNILTPEMLADSQPTKVDFNTYNKQVTQDAILVEKNKMGMEKKAGKEKDIPKKRTKKNLKAKENKAAHDCLQDHLNATMTHKDASNKTCNKIKEYHPKTAKKTRKIKKILEIYNEKVENDLSWVEDLRYVREISPSEYDPALSMLQDDFWDNFDLPGTWNDFDFDV